ncbi:MAG: DinB family protein [Actinomycetota bacterium]
MPDVPPDPVNAGGERETMTAFLDFQRGVMLRKVADLDEEGLRRSMTPSGLTLLGMLKHLAYVERWWFQTVFEGAEVSYPWTDDDPDADWRAEPYESPEEIAGLYRSECERSRRIVAASSFDDTCEDPRGATFTLRWIVAHMIEETARHLGHADIMREAIDGATGD